ncbi:hypothetical protein OPQ81_005348 [Rhizoctonia solani]|nr:hypothetical protein OPQ81_005348 [Rhizoctonia solani]
MLPVGGYFMDQMHAQYIKSDTPKAEISKVKARQPSSDSEDSSSHSSSENSVTKLSSKDKRSKCKIHKLKKKLQKAKKAKKVLPKDPAPYKGQDDLDIFEKWDFETEFWIKAHKIDEETAIRHLCSFLDDKASQWYLCHKIWDMANRYIKVKWIEAGMDGEHTELNVLADAAEQYEKAENVLKSNDRQNNGNHNGYQRNGGTHTGGQTKTLDKPKQNENSLKPETSKAKNDGKKKDGQQKKKDKPKDGKPKLSKEEHDQLWAEGKCFMCKEVGHTLKDCPTKNTAKPSSIYTAAIQFNKIKELWKECKQSYIPIMSIHQFGSPTLTKTQSENPTVVAKEELLCITSEEWDEYEISYKEIAEKACKTYLKQVE